MNFHWWDRSASSAFVFSPPSLYKYAALPLLLEVCPLIQLGSEGGVEGGAPVETHTCTFCSLETHLVAVVPSLCLTVQIIKFNKSENSFSTDLITSPGPFHVLDSIFLKVLVLVPVLDPQVLFLVLVLVSCDLSVGYCNTRPHFLNCNRNRCLWVNDFSSLLGTGVSL